MADLKITDLTETTEAPDTSYIPIDDGETTYKITVGNYNSEANATAKHYAEVAEGYAQDAAGAKDLAVGAKDDAVLAVSSASDYADAASSSADAASGSATEASGYVGQAQTAASNASASALAAATSAQGVEDYAELSKSWCQGGTGKRADEAINNAKYWADVAQGAAGGGVTTFNGRSGVVVPLASDYDANQIDYDNTTSGLVSTDAQAAIDEVAGKIPGKMDTSDYDSTNEVKTAGGIKAFIQSLGYITGLAWNALTGKPFSSIGAGLTVSSDTLTANVSSVDVEQTGTASSSASRDFTISVNNGSEYVIESYMQYSQTLSTSQDTIYGFSNPNINSNSAIDVYTDIYGINPSAVSVSSGVCSVTFPKQSTAQTMTCRIYIK